MISLVNEYITNLNADMILARNVVVGEDITHRSTVLIRNSEATSESACFENEFFIMKNSINLHIEDRLIGNFHILICKKTDVVSVQHFNRVIDYLFVKPDNSYTSNEMLKLFYSLETIFTVTSSRSRALEIGLYGELTVINFFYDNQLGELYKTWHSDFFNKHDFEINDKTKVEVKTTAKENRQHAFRHNQICRPGMNIYVISSMLQIEEKGFSLYDLCRKTIGILDNSDQMLAIELLMNKLGINADYEGICCDLQEAYNGLRLYDASEVPHIQDAIPDGVTNVSYDIDFTGVASLPFETLI